MGGQVIIRPTAIGGVFVVETSQVIDDRGAFARLFCDVELAPVLGTRCIVQINQSRTVAIGAIRGLHYQRPPHAELKLIRCLKGRVFDVAVDLRAGSPTFLKWHAEDLTSSNLRMIVIPEGCAHGFQALELDSELLYLHTARYAPEAESGIRYDDPQVGISWPLPVTEISPRDSTMPLVTSKFSGVHV